MAHDGAMDGGDGDRIEIDGSAGEGGGQVLRTALALSAVTGRAVRVRNIRAGRPRPGLARQHLAAVTLLADMTSARIMGAAPGSTEVTFEPGPIRSGRYVVDIGTAGSVTLVLQAALLPALHADGPVEIHVTGGTDVPWSPTSDYMCNVVLPVLRSIGFDASAVVERRGFYPRGGGRIVLRTRPAHLLRPYCPTGMPMRVEGVAFTRGLPEHVAERMSSSARREMVAAPGDAPALRDVRLRRDVGAGDPGAGIALWTGPGAGPDAPGARADAGDVTAPGTGGPDATTVILGADALGRKGLPAEEVGGAAAGALIADLLSGATVDPHLSDMMVPYIALHGGGYTARVLTSHARTCIDVTNAFLPGSVWVSPPGEVRGADGLYVFTSSTG